MNQLSDTTMLRRVPTQARSKRRVEQILDAAAKLVLERGVADLTTREVARVADVPVASLYQYFSDGDDILLALTARDMAEMDEQVMGDLGLIEDLTLESLIRSVLGSFQKVYARRPAFVEVYLRGRANATINRFGRQHNARVATDLRTFAIDAGLVTPDLSAKSAELAVELGDRVFQLAFESGEVDEDLVEEGALALLAYLGRFSTSA